jgi:hypothetical protein
MASDSPKGCLWLRVGRDVFRLPNVGARRIDLGRVGDLVALSLGVSRVTETVLDSSFPKQEVYEMHDLSWVIEDRFRPNSLHIEGRAGSEGVIWKQQVSGADISLDSRVSSRSFEWVLVVQGIWAADGVELEAVVERTVGPLPGSDLVSTPKEVPCGASNCTFRMWSLPPSELAAVVLETGPGSGNIQVAVAESLDAPFETVSDRSLADDTTNFLRIGLRKNSPVGAVRIDGDVGSVRRLLSIRRYR